MTSEPRPAYDLARLSHAQFGLLAASWEHATPILLAARRAFEITTVILLAMVVWGVFQLCSTAANLIEGTVHYSRNPSLVALDTVSFYSRTRRWLQIVMASFILSFTTWGNGWAQRPIRVSVARGRYTQAVIILDSSVSKAVATMYRLDDAPATTDLEEVLSIYDVTGSMNALSEIEFSVYLTGPHSAGNRRETTTVGVCFRIKEGTVAVNGLSPVELEFHSLELDSILRGVPFAQ
jgi:hypothetical protein